MLGHSCWQLRCRDVPQLLRHADSVAITAERCLERAVGEPPTEAAVSRPSAELSDVDVAMCMCTRNIIEAKLWSGFQVGGAAAARTLRCIAAREVGPTSAAARRSYLRKRCGYIRAKGELCVIHREKMSIVLSLPPAYSALSFHRTSW